MQFIDLKAQYDALKEEINANMQVVLSSAAFIGGKYVKELEGQLAAFTGRKHCITCANGTDALQGDPRDRSARATAARRLGWALSRFALPNLFEAGPKASSEREPARGRASCSPAIPLS